jgi:hypothetical protein
MMKIKALQSNPDKVDLVKDKVQALQDEVYRLQK